MRKFTVRTMKMSEHDDDSWNDIFNCPDDVRRNYAVVDNEQRVFSLLNTFKEATAEADELNTYLETEANQGESNV